MSSSSTRLVRTLASVARQGPRRFPTANSSQQLRRAARTYSVAAAELPSSSVGPTFPGIPGQFSSGSSNASNGASSEQPSNDQDEATDGVWNHRTITIQLDTGGMNLVTAYAILRDIERKFGKLREFGCLRDKFDPSRIYSTMYASFESDESLKRLADSGQLAFPVTVPSRSTSLRNPALDGGVGLEDISDLLRTSSVDSDGYERVMLNGFSGTRNAEQHVGTQNTTTNTPDSSTSENDAPSVVYVRISHGPSDYRFTSPGQKGILNRRSAASRKRISRSFIEWGGFYGHSENGANANLGEQGNIVNEAKLAMSDAINACKTRLVDLGDLDPVKIPAWVVQSNRTTTKEVAPEIEPSVTPTESDPVVQQKATQPLETLASQETQSNPVAPPDSSTETKSDSTASTSSPSETGANDQQAHDRETETTVELPKEDVPSPKKEKPNDLRRTLWGWIRGSA